MGGLPIAMQSKYHAFISYAHEDEKVATRLQKALETFSISPRLAQSFPRGLAPIFKDTTDLTAHHSLSDKIQEAVENSRFLIVLCSSSAKNSHWVNEEIRLFRKIHGEAAILSCLVNGEPKTSFPPALTEGGREPLAANLTPKNFRLGTTQIAATLLGVSLDDLIQREIKRAKRRVIAVTASSTAALLVMGSLTWAAIDARQLAQKRTHDAEGQIEFMITDLTDKLQGVGSLDILQDVGTRAANYYDSYSVSDHDDDALGRRARVFHNLGNLQDKLGDLDEADRYFSRAFEATDELLARDPNHANRVFEHAQSAYWIGHHQHRRKKDKAAKPYFETYLDLAKRLEGIEGPSDRVQTELAYAFTNMGGASLRLGETQKAEKYYAQATEYKQRLYRANPQNRKRLISLANAYAHLANLSLSQSDIYGAQTNWKKADKVAAEFLRSAAGDAGVEYRRLSYLQALSRLSLLLEDKDEAIAQLSIGQDLSAKLLARDPTNVDVRHEDILLKIMTFELALSDQNLAQAKNTLSEIYLDIGHFPDEFKQSGKYRALNATTHNLPIYLALREKDTSKLAPLASQRQQALKALNVQSGDDVITRPDTLSTLILINLILDDDYSKAILHELCFRDDLKLDYLRRELLSARFVLTDCPSAQSENTQLSTIIHQAASYLSAVKLGETK